LQELKDEIKIISRDLEIISRVGKNHDFKKIKKLDFLNLNQIFFI